MKMPNNYLSSICDSSTRQKSLSQMLNEHIDFDQLSEQ